MAEIARLAGNYEPFAGTAQGTERTVFGEETQSDTLTAQHTGAYSRGWRGAVPISGVPTIQDFNALGFSLDQALAYLHQKGIAAWDAAQEYYAGSLCVHDGGLGPQVWMARGEIGGGPLVSTEPSWSFLLGQHCTNIWQPLGAISLPPSDRLSLPPSVLTITVDTNNGPFYSLQHALQAVAWSFKRPIGIEDSGTPSVIIQLPTGYADASQHIIDGLDLSWVTIQHADDEMSCARSALITLVGGVAYGWMNAINGGRAPLVTVNPYLDSSGALTNTALFLAHGKGSVIQWQLDTPAGPPAMHSNSTWGVYATAGARANVTGTGAAYPLINASYGLYATDSGEISLTRALDVASVAVTGGKVSTIGLTSAGTVAVTAAGQLIVNGTLTAALVQSLGASYISANAITCTTTGIVVGTQGQIGCGSATLTDCTAPVVVTGGGSLLVAGAVAATGTGATKISVTGAGSTVEISGNLTADTFSTYGIDCRRGGFCRMAGNVGASSATGGAAAGLNCDAGRIVIGGTYTSATCIDGVRVLNAGEVIITGAVSCTGHSDNGAQVDKGGRLICLSTVNLTTTSGTGPALSVSGGIVRVVGAATLASFGSNGISVNRHGLADFESTVTATAANSGIYAYQGGRVGIVDATNLTNCAGSGGSCIHAQNGGRVAIQGAVTAPAAALSYTIYCERGEMFFGTTVAAANPANLVVVHCDGGIIQANTLNATPNTQANELTVANGGRIMRVGGTGAVAAGDSGASISANGHINR